MQKAKEKDKSNIRVHYWMGCAAIYHCPKGKMADGVSDAVINVVFSTKDQIITAKDLGKAQQAAQHQLVARAGSVEIDIVDVVFTSIPYLGYMTPTEFLGEDLQKGIAEGVASVAAQAANPTVQ